MAEATAVFSVEAAGGVYNYKAGVSIGVDRRIRNDWVSYRSTPSNCTEDRAPPSRSKSGC